MRIYAFFALALPTAIAIACGGGETPPNTPNNAVPSASAMPTDSAAASAMPSASAAMSAAPAMTAWDDKAPVMAQVAFMKANVLPVMSKSFQDHDGKKYANFSCGTCHGPNKENPHKFLPKLKLSGPGDFEALSKKQPDVVKFMHEQVEPQMAKAMGQQPYDMKTNTGFGCKGCHTVE